MVQTSSQITAALSGDLSWDHLMKYHLPLNEYETEIAFCALRDSNSPGTKRWLWRCLWQSEPTPQIIDLANRELDNHGCVIRSAPLSYLWQHDPAQRGELVRRFENDPNGEVRFSLACDVYNEDPTKAVFIMTSILKERLNLSRESADSLSLYLADHDKKFGTSTSDLLWKPHTSPVEKPFARSNFSRKPAERLQLNSKRHSVVLFFVAIAFGIFSSAMVRTALKKQDAKPASTQTLPNAESMLDSQSPPTPSEILSR